MIQINLDKKLQEKGMTLSQLSEIVGLRLANLSILKTGKGRAIRFSTLDAICTALECQPGDIIEYIPNVPYEE